MWTISIGVYFVSKILIKLRGCTNKKEQQTFCNTKLPFYYLPNTKSSHQCCSVGLAIFPKPILRIREIAEFPMTMLMVALSRNVPVFDCIWIFYYENFRYRCGQNAEYKKSVLLRERRSRCSDK